MKYESLFCCIFNLLLATWTPEAAPAQTQTQDPPPSPAQKSNQEAENSTALTPDGSAFGAASTSRQVKLGQAKQVPGKAVSLPVNLVSQGNENALGFSVIFDPLTIRFSGTKNGTALSSEAQVIINSNAASSGRLGVLIGLSPGQTFLHGSQTLLSLEFQVLDNAPLGQILLALGDWPVVREVVSPDVLVLPMEYSAGSIEISSASTLTSASGRLADGSFLLEWSASPGSYRLEVSPNLVDWFFVADMTSDEGTIRYVDNGAKGQSGQFYRVIRIDKAPRDGAQTMAR